MTDDSADPAPGPPARPKPPSSGDGVVRESAHGRNFSYFSHRVFVSFQPVDLHNYLSSLIEIVPGTRAPGTSAGTPDKVDEVDAELIRWVLIHRSQLNMLSLNRLVESLRGEDDLLMIPSSETLRSDEGYRIDMTLQFAIELELGNPRFAAWVDKRPRLQQAMIDAAYYVSRRWLEQDRIDIGAGDDRAPGAGTFDLGPDGRKAFRAYLLHRMNLREDDVVTTDPDVLLQRTRRDAMALTDQELEILYSVAVGVARTMAFAEDAVALKKRWSECAAQNRPGAMSMPSQALFDALWLGHAKSLLDPVDDVPDRLVFKWRYLPSGAGAPPPTLETLVKDVDADERDMDSFARLDDVLRQANPDVNIGEQHILAALADRYRVLRTTPAWTAVASARANIEHARSGVGNPVSLRRDVTTLREYREMIRSGPAARAVQAALLAATFLANAGRTGNDLPMATALTALSEGLQLADCDLPDVARRLVELWGELSRIAAPAGGDAVASASLNLGEWATPAALQAALAGAANAGFKLGNTPLLTTQQESAWSRVVPKLQAFLGDASVPLANAAEIICAVRREGPGAVDGPTPSLGLAPSAMTPHAWSRALLTSLTRSTSTVFPIEPAIHKNALTWIAAAAGVYLGIRAINPDMQAKIMDAFGPETAKELRQIVAQGKLWSGHGRYARAALVVRGDGPSFTDAWFGPPNGGLLLVIKASEAGQWVSAAFDNLLAAVKDPLLVAWEPQATTEESEVTIRRKLLGTVAAAMKRDVWLYRGSAIGDQEPKILDANSADDLWLTRLAP
jgi:hypothetical protein